MKKKLDDTIEVVVYENIKNVTSKKEREVIEKFKQDINLPIFIKKNINYSRISYEDEIDTTFARACIQNKIIIQYQTQRLNKIKKEVSQVKANRCF